MGTAPLGRDPVVRPFEDSIDEDRGFVDPLLDRAAEPFTHGALYADDAGADRVKILGEAFKKAMDTPEWKKFAQDQYLEARESRARTTGIAGAAERMKQYAS